MAGDLAIRRMAAAAVLLVAAIAAVISFVHIEHLARADGQTALAAALLPISIDGTVAAASLVMLRAARAGLGTPWLARVMLGLAVVATLAANVANGARFGPAGALLSGWPAVAFIGSAEMALGMVRRARQAAPTDATAAEAGPPTPSAAVASTSGQRPGSDRPRTRPAGGQPKRSGPDTEAAALAAIAARPGLSGADLGREVGVSERTGRRLLDRLGNGGAG